MIKTLVTSSFCVEITSVFDFLFYIRNYLLFYLPKLKFSSFIFMAKRSKIYICKEYLNLYDQYTKKYGSVALFYQVGNFYEIFGIENEREKLGNIIQLTKDIGIRYSRVIKKIKTVSRSNPLMAGVPIGVIDEYVGKAIKRGYTCVVYSQMDAKGANNKTKKIRVLDKIRTCGTFIDNDDIEDMALNIIGIYVHESSKVLDISIICVDLSTGKCVVDSVINDKDNAINITTRIVRSHAPKEIVYYSDVEQITPDTFDMKNAVIRYIKPDKAFFKESYQDEFLGKIYQSNNILSPVEYVGMERNPSLVVCLIMIFQYIYEQDPNIIQRVSKPEIREHKNFLEFTNSTEKILNITYKEDPKDKTLYDVLNFCKTAMGKRLLKTKMCSPVHNISELEGMYNKIEAMFDFDKDCELDTIIDLDRYHRKIFLKVLSPAEFTLLDVSYVNVLSLLKNPLTAKLLPKKIITSFKKFFLNYRKTINFNQADLCSNISAIDKPIFKKGICSELDELYLQLEIYKKELNEYATEMCDYLGESKAVLVDLTPSEGYFLSTTNKRFKSLEERGYKFEVKKNSTKVKLFNDKIRGLSSGILETQSRMIKKNRSFYLEFLEELSRYHLVLKTISDHVALLDYFRSCAIAAKKYNYVRPVLTSERMLKGYKIRHPILERIGDEDFVSNDVNLSNNTSSILLYGVNGSGKSVYIKSVLLNIIMAQIGMFVACEHLKFKPFEHILTKLGLKDNMYKQKSTFQCEMEDLRLILNKANENSFVVADELCAGTATSHAIGLVAASIQTLQRKDVFFIFTTHLHQLKDIDAVFESKKTVLKHFDVTFDKNINYGRRLKDGGGTSSYGIEIAKYLSVGDDNFFRTANKIKNDLEGKPHKILSTKESKYNSDLYVHSCEVCGSYKDLQVDHITPQKLADEEGMISGLHKNRKQNLRVLCKGCHATRKDRPTELVFKDDEEDINEDQNED